MFSSIPVLVSIHDELNIVVVIFLVKPPVALSKVS